MDFLGGQELLQRQSRRISRSVRAVSLRDNRGEIVSHSRSKSGADLSVIIACFNEEYTITPMIRDTILELDQTYPGTFELIVVDDGSEDNTLRAAEESAVSYSNVRVIHLSKNGGKGNAVREGFLRSTGDIVCLIDGDHEISPEQIAPAVQTLAQNDYDILIGSKRHRKSHVDYPARRRMLSFAYHLFVQILLGLKVSDSQVGLKVFRRGTLETTLPDVSIKRFAFDIELLTLAHEQGFRIGEIPVEINFMQRYGSNVDLKAILHMFLDTLRVFYRRRIAAQ